MEAINESFSIKEEVQEEGGSMRTSLRCRTLFSLSLLLFCVKEEEEEEEEELDREMLFLSCKMAREEGSMDQFHDKMERMVVRELLMRSKG